MTATAARSPLRARSAGIVESMRRIRIDGIEARYLLAGSGPPVLVVASPLALARTYLPVARKLASSFTVVVVEPPGAGGSQRLDEPWSFERYGKWLVDLVRHMPLAAPIIVGHSDSAPMVVEAARLARDELRGMVLVGATGACEPSTVLRMVAARARAAAAEPLFSLRITPHLLRNALRHRKTMLAHVRAAAAVDLARAAEDIHLPTLLAWGDRDHTVPLDCASRLGRVIDGAKLVVGSGSHDWMVTHADAFAAAVRRFSADIAQVRRS